MKSLVGTTQNSKGEVLRHLYRAFAANQALTILGGAMLATFIATLVGVFVDHRVITLSRVPPLGSNPPSLPSRSAFIVSRSSGCSALSRTVLA